MARSASAAITTSAKDNPADDFYSSLIVVTRRSHQLAPFVRWGPKSMHYERAPLQKVEATACRPSRVSSAFCPSHRDFGWFCSHRTRASPFEGKEA
jgi:hypothetical protein